ncbi:MAG TPA: hypothetical protein VHT52_22225 [Stellaceae bacterium]|nr:hypothetical protein [Stellaceae bacterium]
MLRPLRALLQFSRFFEAGIEMGKDFGVTRPGCGPITGPFAIKAGPLGQAGLAEVVSQDFRLRLRDFGEILRERTADTGV